MKEKLSTNFLIGVLFGILVAAVIWYWQKSTAADEGALTLLDRLADTEARLRKMRADIEPSSGAASPTTTAPEVAPPTDDLQMVKGIGPTYAERLAQAGIVSIRQLVALEPHMLAEILQTGESRAEAILADAQQMS